MTKEEFARRIKQKYPDYSEVPDMELADRMIAKYPQYKDALTDVPVPDTKTAETAKRFEAGAGVQQVEPPVGERFAYGLSGAEHPQNPPGADIGDIGAGAGVALREGLPIALGAIGAEAGPLGVGVGAGAGQALVEAGQAAVGTKYPELAQEKSLADIAGSVGKTGLEFGLAEGALRGAGAIGPTARLLGRAYSKADVGKSYEAF